MTPQLRFPEFTDEWLAKKLGKVVDFKNGKPFEDYVDESGEYSLITIDSVSIDGKLKNKFKKVTRSDNSLKKNDIVTVLSDIAHGELLGLTSLIPADNKFVLNQRMGRLRPREGASPSFLSHYINTRQLYYRKRGQGTSQRHIYERDINQMPINLPSICEQEKIADFLTAVDERIAASERKCELLTRYKHGVMQQLFSQKIRFKKLDGTNYPDWQERKMEEVFDVVRGNVLATTQISRSKNENKKYPVYSSQTKHEGLLGYYHEYLYENAITWTTDGANAGAVMYRPGKFYCTNVCGVLISRDGYANKATAEMLNRVTKKYVSYVGNPKLMNNVMASIKIRLPTPEEQQKIADFLTTLDDRITAEHAKLTTAKQFKKVLLQRMFV